MPNAALGAGKLGEASVETNRGGNVNQKELAAALATSLRQLRQVYRAAPSRAQLGIHTLGLPSHVARCLRKNGIVTVGDLIEQDAEKLVLLRGFGPGRLVATEAALKTHKLQLDIG